MKNVKNKEIISLGNISGLKTQSRAVYDVKGICPTLTSGMSHGNTVPYIIAEPTLPDVNIFYDKS